ncbi:MAG: hemerythrin family protein [Deltaproteobacteria bacterium]|nr:hemerythrin family protein [Deltaproteobacteria bacterium]
MALFNWSDRYSVDVGVFDGHHKRLVELINELHDAMRSGHARDMLGSTLKGLIDYTRMHFAEEERLMSAHGYAGLAAHRIEHEKLVTKVSELHAKYVAGDNTLTIETMNFLKDWLINHILVTDKQYGVFFKSRGVV